MRPFAESRPFTLGVEIEFQIVHPERLELTSGGPSILAQAKKDPLLKEFVKPEFIRSMIELVTPVCDSVEELAAWLKDAIKRLFELSEGRGYLLIASSLHPFSKASDQKVWEDPRYESIRDELQIVGRRFISQGLHIHIGMSSPEDCIYAYRWTRLFLPVFLALTTSSPFYEGEMTGLYSYRSKLFEALPLAGYPRDFSSYEEFEKLVKLLLSHGIIERERDLWWDVRPHPYFGTLEVRVCDLPSRFSEIVAVVALVKAFVKSVFKEKREPPSVPQEVLKYNKWQAARHGIDGFFLNPVTLRKNTFRETVKEFLFMCASGFDSEGERRYIREVEEILERGTAAHRQIEVYLSTNDLREVVKSTKEEFWS